MKYRPECPARIGCIEDARSRCQAFFARYNDQHRHSGISFVIPAQRHAKTDEALLQARAAVYEQARQQNPQRWSAKTRDWTFIDAVHLNPDSPENKEVRADQKAA